MNLFTKIPTPQKWPPKAAQIPPQIANVPKEQICHISKPPQSKIVTTQRSMIQKRNDPKAQ